MTATDRREVRVVIVGSGFAGLGMAIRLKQAGVDDFVVLERAGDVGGTWRDNTYPGCMCDVPSHLYSFSFAPKADWSCTYPSQPEIWRYLRECAERFGVLPHIRFHSTVTDAAWDRAAERWDVRATSGNYVARFLVLGVGPLSDPKLPEVPGLDTFQGSMFHSAQWDHAHDLRGERVAVVGTGASSIQFVPRIQPVVAHLDLYQRTPPWIMPHPNRDLTTAEQWLDKHVPQVLRLRRAGVYASRELMVLGFAVDPRIMALAERVARRHLERQVHDPALRRVLTPHYRLGCKRVLLSNDYYPALTQTNVTVIGDGIREVRPHAVVGGDGVERPVDTIIFGTGFHVTDMPIAARVRGADGRSLADVWEGSPQAYLGTTINGCPNLFFLLGPNTGLGHTSVVYMVERQIEYVLRCMRELRRRDCDVIEVTPEAQAAYNRRIQERMRRTVWTTGGCASWYIDAKGRNTTLWPTFTFAFQRRVARFDAAAYTVRRSGAPAVAAA